MRRLLVLALITVSCSGTKQVVRNDEPVGAEPVVEMPPPPPVVSSAPAPMPKPVPPPPLVYAPHPAPPPSQPSTAVRDAQIREARERLAAAQGQLAFMEADKTGASMDTLCHACPACPACPACTLTVNAGTPSTPEKPTPWWADALKVVGSAIGGAVALKLSGTLSSLLQKKPAIEIPKDDSNDTPTV